ncbi:MAG: hypothetical protein HZB91_03125 [Elusimicrobia bacterium]|nr:hypothetical protein [Elusimicrobiota bacterium]
MRLLWLAALLAVPAGVCWAQHGGHGGHGGYEPMSGSREDEDREERKSRLEKLERLGEKVEKIDEELAKPDIAAKKREKLEKKLKKLLAQRDKLLPGAGGPVIAPPRSGLSTAEAAYSCPMGHYSGARTKDGRCPECGMALEAKGSRKTEARFEVAPSSRPACGSAAGAGADACRTP